MIPPASIEARRKVPAFSAIDINFQIAQSSGIFQEIPLRKIDPLLKRALGGNWLTEIFSLRDYLPAFDGTCQGLTGSQKRHLWEHMAWGVKTYTVVEAPWTDQNGRTRHDQHGRLVWDTLHKGVVTRENIETFRKIQMAGPRYAAILAMESDNPETLQRLIEFGAAPNLLAVRTSWQDKEDGKVSRPGQWQAIWILNFPVRFKDDEEKPTKSAVLYRAIQKTISHLTGGDPAFTGRIMRNPFHDDQDYDWQWVHYQKYGLNDLKEACLKSGYCVDRARYLPRSARSVPPKETPKQGAFDEEQHDARPTESEQQWIDRIIQEGADFSRNFEVFTALSRRSTSWRYSGRPVHWGDLERYAERLNHLLKSHSPKGVLGPQELRGIVQSVHDWEPNKTSRRSDWEPPERGGSWRSRPGAEGLYGGHFCLEQCSKGGVTTWRRHRELLLKVRLPKARQRSQEVRSRGSRVKMAKIWELHCGGLTVGEIIEELGYPRSTVYALLSKARRGLAGRGSTTISLTTRSTNKTPHNESGDHGSARPDGGPQESPEEEFNLPEMPLKLARRRKKAQRLAKMDATEPISREQSA